MYDTKYECQYYKDEVFLETDDVTEEETDYIRDCLYKEDFLNIFLMDDRDESDSFNKVISDLYKSLKTCSQLRVCMKIIAARYVSEDEELGLCMLYSYDFMYLMHKCVCSYLENGVILEEDLQLLTNKIEL